MSAKVQASVVVRVLAFLGDCAVLVGLLFVAALLVPGEAAIEGLLTTVLGAAYFIFSWSLMGATPVQRLCAIRVVQDDCTRLSTTRAAVRWIALGAPLWIAMAVAPGLLGVLAVITSGTWTLMLLWSALRDPMHRGLHDRVSGSQVIRRESGR